MLARALKTHANSNKYAKFCLKPTHFATNAGATQPAAGAGAAVNVAVRASSVEKHNPHAPTQLRLARSHARHEHETKPKPISRLGSAVASFPTTSDIYTDTTTLRVIRRFVGRVGQLRFESRCRDQLLILSVQIICWHQLLRLSAESSC